MRTPCSQCAQRAGRAAALRLARWYMLVAQDTSHPRQTSPNASPTNCAHAPQTHRVVPARAQGLPKSSATTQFAEDLFNRIPRASGAQVGSYQQQERAAAAYARKAAAYTVLSDDEEDQADVDLPAPTTQAIPKGSRKQLRKAQVPILGAVLCCEMGACQGRAALWCTEGFVCGIGSSALLWISLLPPLSLGLYASGAAAPAAMPVNL